MLEPHRVWDSLAPFFPVIWSNPAAKKQRGGFWGMWKALILNIICINDAVQAFHKVICHCSSHLAFYLVKKKKPKHVIDVVFFNVLFSTVQSVIVCKILLPGSLISPPDTMQEPVSAAFGLLDILGKLWSPATTLYWCDVQYTHSLQLSFINQCILLIYILAWLIS